MEEHIVARELGKLTEAVEGLRRDVSEFKAERADLSQRVGYLENYKSWTKGWIGALGVLVATLGLDRLSHFFRSHS